MITPLGINTFIATGVLTVLGRMFDINLFLKKKHDKDSLKDMRKDLKERLKPFYEKVKSSEANNTIHVQ